MTVAEADIDAAIRVLLVEDSPSVAMQIQGFLKKAPDTNFIVEHRQNLGDGIELIRSGEIDIILLDLGLPDSDGLDTFSRMRQAAPDIPTIVFTGVSDESTALEALRRGAQDYLVKGQVDRRLLVRAIRYSIERKQAEERLRLSEEKHRTLLEAMPDVVYKIDATGRFIFINKAIERLGYDPEALIGRHFKEIIHPEDVACFSRSSVLPRFEGRITGHYSSPKLVDERRAGDRMTRDLVLRIIPANWNTTDDSTCLIGSVTSYGEVTATGHYTQREGGQKNKEFTGTVGIIKDITERRKMEEEKEALEAQLQQSQKMEAIGRLAGGVAHDMNNLLGAIHGSASLLDAETGPEDGRRIDIENILMACRKGRDLTRNLLGFARKGKYIKQNISLGEVAQEAKELLVRTISKRIVVELELEEEEDFVEGDRNQIHHALMNVCINAADAVEGQGKITIGTRCVLLREEECEALGDMQPGKYVELRITDTGTGMTDEAQAKAFEPFFTTKPKGEGTGLGLSMVYGVVKNHGGAVTLESEQGVGTTVVFLLPFLANVQRKSTPPSTKLPSTKPDRGGILLVDDELAVRTSVRRLLEKLGYTVFLAENGRVAVEMYQKKRKDISLVLLDLVMPVMDGTETFEVLKELDPNVRVLLSSGYSKDEKVEPLLNRGAIGFIQKPYEFKTLADVLKASYT